MQIIQSTLGNNVHPLGIISFLSNSHKMGFRQESHFLHSRSNFISPIHNKAPLVTSSKFSLSREHESSIQQLIGWDSWDSQDINSEFPLLEVDSFNSIDTPEKNNLNSSASVKNIIPEIMPTRIDKNISNDALSQINIKSKSKSKKNKKSQQPAEKKSKTKSNTKKTVQLSAPNNIKQFIDESNIPINFNEDGLLASDKHLSVEANSEIPKAQLDITSDNTTIEPYFVNDITEYTSPIIEDKSTSFSNLTNDELQLKSELPSSLPSAESFIVESILQSEENIELKQDISRLVEDSFIDFPLHNNKEKLPPSKSFTNNEEKVISETSESADISDMPISLTPSEKNIKIYQSPSIGENKNTDNKTNSIQPKNVSLGLDSPLLSKESSPTNSNSEAITSLEPSLILENTSNDFFIDNAVADNSLENTALSSELISPDIDNTTPSLSNNENTIETHKYTPKTYVAVPNPESSITKKTIRVQQEVDSSVTSESPASAPVQLTPTPADIEDMPSLLTNSNNNEQLVNSESQSTMAVNVSDVSANVTSLEHNSNSNVENTTNESTENQPILALPEIGETRISNDNLLDVYAPLSATSPEISETGISNDKPLDVYAPLPKTSPEIAETPVFSATSPEIGETGISNDKLLDVYAPLSATSPEISETGIS
ncbi:hypothetical protein, partial [Nostoc sp. UHCC 0251]|uniref:hypothetical protein n=1 Tax=Nostoc sp. UHCC 0251 TaxID=3110240 RepID=UPI002B20B8B7